MTLRKLRLQARYNVLTPAALIGLSSALLLSAAPAFAAALTNTGNIPSIDITGTAFTNTGTITTDNTQPAVYSTNDIESFLNTGTGAIVGDSYGMLKLLVSTEDRTLLGVHVFGSGATDLVHIGQAIMGCGGTVDYLVDTVLNYPTLSEAYKVAALDVTNKMRALAVFDGG